MYGEGKKNFSHRAVLVCTAKEKKKTNRVPCRPGQPARHPAALRCDGPCRSRGQKGQEWGWSAPCWKVWPPVRDTLTVSKVAGSTDPGACASCHGCDPRLMPASTVHGACSFVCVSMSCAPQFVHTVTAQLLICIPDGTASHR